MPLDLHPASEAERLAAYRNVHDVWSHGLPMEEHLARRLRSVQHNRAEWFVGCLKGEVVTSLGAYPLWFHLHGQMVRGIAIGSVHTPAAHRGQGFAPRLMAWVEDHLRQCDGAALSLLYSDIRPEYYARQGYLLCPAHEGWTTWPRLSETRMRVSERLAHVPGPIGQTEESALRPTGDALDEMQLVPIDIQRDVSEMAGLYAAFHRSLPLAIARRADYWQYLLHKGPADEFYWLHDAHGERQAYVRLAQSGETWKIADYALARHDEELLGRLYESVLGLAARRGIAGVGGWLPDVAAARQCFAMQPRAKEITMIKPLEPAIRIDVAAAESTTWFCEIDRV